MVKQVLFPRIMFKWSRMMVWAQKEGTSSIQTELSKLQMSNGSNSSPSVISKFPHQPGVDESIKQQTWYFGCISRTQCDTILNEFADDGDFLIRDSETKCKLQFCKPANNDHIPFFLRLVISRSP